MLQEMNFKVYPRKVYKRTFLNVAFVVFSYSIEDVSQEVLASINQFLLDNFNSSETITKENFLRGFSFDSEEKGLSYFLSAKHLGVKYFKNDYVSFQQTMMPLIYPLMAFMRNVIPVTEIEDIKIRKVNIYAEKCQTGASFNEKHFVESFLSKDLISNAQSDGANNDLRDAHVFEGRTNSLYFTLKYGLKNKEFDGTEYCGLILDECVKTDSVLLSNVETVLLDANTTLYNIFHWSVNKEILAFMDKEV